LGRVVAGLRAHAGRVAFGHDHHRRPLRRVDALRGGAVLVPPVVAGDPGRGALKELADEYQKLDSPIAGQPASLFASGDQVAALIAGTFVSAVVGYLSIAFLLRFLQRNSTAVFVAYRLVMGTVILVLLRAAVLK
jgi:hypothetical protein